MSKLRLSYTKLSFYLTCPKRYYYRYVEKRPFYPSMMAKYGSNIHRALKDVSQILKDEGKIDEKTQDNLYKKQWTDVTKDESKNLELKNLGIKQVQDFITINQADFVNTLYLEKSFSVPFQNITLCGYIDRVDQLSDGKVEILDYKTGSIRNLSPEDLQLNFYALICRDYLNLIPAKLSLYFLKTNRKVSVHSSNDNIDCTRELIISTAGRISAEDYSLTRTEPESCRECSYKRICPDTSC